MDQKKLVNKKALHNLKSSLAAILGYLQLIEQQINNQTQIDNKLLNLFEKAKNSINSLENQIKDLESDNSSTD